MTAAVIVSLRAGAAPMRAFEVFTAEIGAWWVGNPMFGLTPDDDGSLHLEPGVGGRLITTLANGDGFEVGRILIWQPGAHLALNWRQASFASDQSTRLDVRFEPVGHETRITVEHCGWDTIPQEHAARHGFALALFQRRLVEHWRVLLASPKGNLSKT